MPRRDYLSLKSPISKAAEALGSHEVRGLATFRTPPVCEDDLKATNVHPKTTLGPCVLRSPITAHLLFAGQLAQLAPETGCLPIEGLQTARVPFDFRYIWIHSLLLWDLFGHRDKREQPRTKTKKRAFPAQTRPKGGKRRGTPKARV